MPTLRKSARLWLRPARRDKKTGRIVARATYLILDAGKHYPTGCFAGEAERAERKLAEYIAAKYQAPRKGRDLEDIPLADVLSIYIDDRGPKQRNRAKFDERMARLNEFWGAMRLSEVTGDACRRYVAERGNAGGSRRDLEDLRAAINHHAREGLHHNIVRVALPEKGPARDRWLTRGEAAKLLWTCWRHRETQLRHCGPHRGQRLPTKRYPLRHLARFLLIALYTGTRAGAIAKASPNKGEGRSFVDLDHGVFYRLPEGDRLSKKRQPPAPIPSRLLAHMRRWRDRKIIGDRFVEWNGEPVASVKTALKTAVRLAKLPGKVTPHTFRHTAATWLMLNGVNIWRAAGYLGMSVETLDRVYGHHHPDFLSDAADAIGRKPNRNQALVVSLVGAAAKREKLK
jgi:integrase